MENTMDPNVESTPTENIRPHVVVVPADVKEVRITDPVPTTDVVAGAGLPRGLEEKGPGAETPGPAEPEPENEPASGPEDAPVEGPTTLPPAVPRSNPAVGSVITPVINASGAAARLPEPE
jgi:hypothetical protein